MTGMKLEDLLRRGKAAFVLTEVQEGIVGSKAPWPALAEAAAKIGLLDNAARIATAARAAGAPVIHCTAENMPLHFGSNRNAKLFGMAKKLRSGPSPEGYDDPHPAVWQQGDIVLPRFHGLSAMTGSPLDTLLRNEGITTIVISGVSLCFGVLSLTMDAVNRSYQVIIARDTVAGFPEDYAEQVLDNTLAMLTTITTAQVVADAWSVVAGSSE
jgi:nicotinamidase-related amidase